MSSVSLTTTALRPTGSQPQTCTQVLLDRGPAPAGVVIDSAGSKGVFTLEPTSLLSLGQVLATPFGWRRIADLAFTEFGHAFVHTLSLAKARSIKGRADRAGLRSVYFEARFSMLDRR